MNSSLLSAAPQASSIDPDTVRKRMACVEGVELYTRARPPGSVELKTGHSDHLLMCTMGEAIGGQPVRSYLRSDGIEREWTHCPKWHVTFLPAGTPMAWDWSYRSRSVHMAIRPEAMSLLSEQLQCTTLPKPAFRVHNTELSGHLYDLLAEAERGEAAGSELALTSLVNLVAVSLCRLDRPVACDSNADKFCRRTPGLRRRFHSLLLENLERSVSIDDLAREVNLSTRHFARLFRQQMGMPPHRYQLELRIRKAQDLLRNQPRSKIVEIAQSLGFVDESHFRRHFKRIVGVTPSQFRG